MADELQLAFVKAMSALDGDRDVPNMIAIAQAYELLETIPPVWIIEVFRHTPAMVPGYTDRNIHEVKWKHVDGLWACHIHYPMPSQQDFFYYTGEASFWGYGRQPGEAVVWAMYEYLRGMADENSPAVSSVRDVEALGWYEINQAEYNRLYGSDMEVSGDE